MNNIKKHLKALSQSQEGAVLPLVGLAFITLIICVGVAVDYGRAQMVQSKMHSALDAAGLAAASVAKSRDPEVEVLKFMEANFPQGYMQTRAPENSPYPDSFVTKIDVTEDPQDSSVTIDLAAAGVVDTVIMRVVGITEVPVSAAATVQQARRRGFEMVMVLDNSGSMRQSQDGITRRKAMVNAAKKMLEELYKDKNQYDNLFIGLVPFSNQVSVGGARKAGSKWLRASAAANIAVDGDIYCVDDGAEDRDLSYAVTAQPPIASANPSALFVKTAVQVKKDDDPDDDCRAVEMTAMLNSRNKVEKALDAMISDGTTRVDVGAVWGWRMLSPRWAGRWNHESSGEYSNLPLARNTPNMDKVIILLTDGANNPQNKKLVTVKQADDRLRSACYNMKNDDDIIVYAITFHDRRNEKLMKECASSADHYYHATGSESIKQVFRQIADSLMSLRISK